uniref:Pyruvate ferredoxin oxidoreductase n=1 Tax=Prevotella sp. GTC17260 TaxID=3236796 RepID=A0AB33JCC5_9BACT
MDYKYIDQLLARYWDAQTTLEEEEILKAFFSQEDIPASLLKYKPLFAYEQQEVRTDVLGSDFDAKILSMIEEVAPVKARTVSMAYRLRPLFKAAAVVAIILTLGNAAQATFDDKTEGYAGAAVEKTHEGAAVALTDSAVIDSVQHSSIDAVPMSGTAILK